MTQTYPDAPASVIARWQGRRTPLRFAPGEALPPLDADLTALAGRIVTALPPETPPPESSFARKRHALTEELAGRSELALLHALLIACLRKRRWPADAPALFRRLWIEMGEPLRAELPTRWLISAAITFADHGATEAERRLGQSLNLLFSLMKLYEFERLHSGCRPDQPFPRGKKVKSALPIDMPGFSLVSGGLDYNLLGPIWAEAERVPVLGPLALHLLDRLNADPGTLFRRLQHMRAGHSAAGKPSDP